MEAHQLLRGDAGAGAEAAAGASAEAPAEPPAQPPAPVLEAVRRALDLVIATLALVLLAPLIAAIALAIRLDTPGPVIFRQRRIGRDLEPFTVFKFRTMRDGAPSARHREYVRTLIGAERGAEPRGELYKLVVDDRVTRAGRVLRRWSLDELPQLVNVVRGEMALVGPRPVIAYEVEHYPRSYLGRFAVRPGLTGLWQVSGRNERSYHEMVELDLAYARENSMRGDLAILARTALVVVRRQGVA